MPRNVSGLAQHAQRQRIEHGIPRQNSLTLSRDGFLAGAGGGLISTTADLDRFFRALLSGRLLRPAEMREMKQTTEATEIHVIWPDAWEDQAVTKLIDNALCGRR